MMTTAREGAHHFWTPLLDGTGRLGVLGVTAPAAQPSTVDDVRALASLIALMLVSKRPHSDTYHRLVRAKPMAVAAEVGGGQSGGRGEAREGEPVLGLHCSSWQAEAAGSPRGRARAA